MSEKPTFKTAKSKGTITHKDGYHQPQNAHWRSRCPCDLTTDKGAYRDVSIELEDGRIVHYYHQSPVAITHPDGRVRVDNCGYQTSTTKERINRYVPNGYRVFQRDFEWYVSTPNDDTIPFENGMVLG